MRAVIVGNNCTIQDGRGREIFTLKKETGADRYLIVPPKDKGLRFEGNPRGTGEMRYMPGITIGIYTMDGVVMMMGSEGDLGGLEVGAR